MFLKVCCVVLLLLTVAAMAKDPLPRRHMEALKLLFGDYERASRVAEEIIKRSGSEADRTTVVELLQEIKLKNGSAPEREDAIGVVVVVDRSLSMDYAPLKEQRRKIDIARSATEDILGQLKGAAVAKDKDVRALVLAFDGRVKELMPMTRMKDYAPNSVGSKLTTLSASGTAIGSALLAAQKQLALTKLKRNHIVVLTDGESNEGVEPHLVLQAFQFLTAEEFPIVHFIAFDVKRDVFNALNPYLYDISEASDSRQLKDVIDTIIRQEIFAEKPSE